MKNIIKQTFQQPYLEYIKEVTIRTNKDNSFYEFTQDPVLVHCLSLWAGLYENKKIIKEFYNSDLYIIGFTMLRYPMAVLEIEAPDTVKLWALHMLFNKEKRFKISEVGFDKWQLELTSFIIDKGYPNLIKYL